MSNPPKIVCFGEILWDLFPNGKKIGGAPLNVALSLHQLGAEVLFISRIGTDHLGEEILNEVKKYGLSELGLQRDQNFPTGTVSVNLNNAGVAHYSIEQNAAWDFIEPSSEIIQRSANANAFVFGSLIDRTNSEQALDVFLKTTPFAIFDVNLRPPYYSYEKLKKRMMQAHLIKFNEEELSEISYALGGQSDILQKQIEFIVKETNTDQICVTLGARGAIMFLKGNWFFNNGYAVKVKDTVGAGDAFLATLIYGLLTDEPQISLDRACAMGALVASNEGANPLITEKDLLQFINSKTNR